MAARHIERRLPVGAEPLPGGVHFRVWAPRRKKVAVQIEDDATAKRQGGPRVIDLKPEKEGYFSDFVPRAGPGSLYRFLLDRNPFPFPDPASRFQPQGPAGPSEVIDPGAYRWGDRRWRGVRLKGQVIYEMHIGTFTPEGTWDAAAHELPELAALGVTTLEIMPVAEFPGRFGWGYDGVDLFAPTHLYGRPDDFRRFIDAAHAHHLGVILDVVYNHVGPSKNYLKEYSATYFTDRYQTEWGQPMNFDGPGSGPVREFFIANAGYWPREYHLDGLRLDATQNIYDASPEHILAALAAGVRTAAAGRRTLIVAENEPQDARLIRPAAAGGYGLDALWNDDFHHSAMVALTGRNEAYYTDYLGRPQELLSAVKRGFLYQGQWYVWQKKPRGTPVCGAPPGVIDPAAFVCFLQNHDQVANSFRGVRLPALTSPGRLKALTALLLLAPSTPMLFQGQEFAASSPFLYFADHEEELARLVYQGRVEFLRQFCSLTGPGVDFGGTNPASPETFLRSKLDFGERQLHGGLYALHRELLRLRRQDPVFSAQRADRLDGAVLAGEAFVLRWFGSGGDDRLLLVNLGRDLSLCPVPEPLLAPPCGMQWAVLWSSEDPLYGGGGTPPLEVPGAGWRIPGHAAVALRPEKISDALGKGGRRS